LTTAVDEQCSQNSIPETLWRIRGGEYEYQHEGWRANPAAATAVISPGGRLKAIIIHFPPAIRGAAALPKRCSLGEGTPRIVILGTVRQSLDASMLQPTFSFHDDALMGDDIACKPNKSTPSPGPARPAMSNFEENGVIYI
jgi:hypothetical protein